MVYPNAVLDKRFVDGPHLWRNLNMVFHGQLFFANIIKLAINCKYCQTAAFFVFPRHRPVRAYFHYLCTIMKKPVKSLFLFALLFAVAGAFVVSCQKEGGEAVPEVGEGQSWPDINPRVSPSGNSFRIIADGTSFMGTSAGYSYLVMAKAITFINFTCDLGTDQEFELFYECNLTLQGKSVILMNSGKLTGDPVNFSGNGSLTFKKLGKLNLLHYNPLFVPAEGYTMTFSGEVEEGNNWYSYTWTVRKSK